MAASIGACRTQAPEDVLGSRSAPEANWFCGAGADGQWECVQDRALVASPDLRDDRSVSDGVPASAPRPVGSVRSEREAVLEWRAEHYAVQLIASESEQAVTRLAERLAIPELLRVRVESRGRFLHVLLVGPFAERRTAASAASGVVRRMPSLEPWVRSVGTLQAAVRRGQQEP